jgi:hypothetical protein
MISIDRISNKASFGKIPSYSAYGYIINSNGDVYAPNYKYQQGFLLALLYPEILEDFRKTSRGIELGHLLDVNSFSCIDDVDDSSFQEFEVFSAEKIPAIRVASKRFLRGADVSIPNTCSTKQVTALRNVFLVLGLTSDSPVFIKEGKSTVIKLLFTAMNAASLNLAPA